MNSFLFNAIGYVRSPFLVPEGTPIQPVQGSVEQAHIVIHDEFTEGLADIGGFSHLILLSVLHKSNHPTLQVVPFLDNVPRGVFSTRAPARPNPVGISVVKLVAVEKNVLIIEEFDLLDGTPILDIKPFIPDFDHRENVRTGWYANTTKDFRNVKDDSRFCL
jgi:tRNA-Thr(GGU) m(6)t(6)A37 methyltransferase TsaA